MGKRACSNTGCWSIFKGGHGDFLSLDSISTLHAPSIQEDSYAERIRLREEKATQAKTREKTKGEISYGRTNKRTKKGTKKKGCTQNQTSTDAERESSGTGGAGDQYAFADPKELRTLWEAPEPHVFTP